MRPGKTAEVAPSPWRDHRTAFDALRRRVAVQSSVDPGEGVKARRVLFSAGNPAGDLLAGLAALDKFERAIVERDDRSVVEARRRECLAILDRIIGA